MRHPSRGIGVMCLIGPALTFVCALGLPAVAVAAPSSITYAKSSFATAPAEITLMSAGGTLDSERVRDIYYRLDAEPQKAAHAYESITRLPFPPAPDRVPSPMRAAPPIPPYAWSKTLILPGHFAGPDAGTDDCSTCHYVAEPEWIEPPPWTPAIPAVWVPHATQECEHCHEVGWIDPPITSLATTDVVVSVPGTHTLEFWGINRSGAEETPHKTFVFSIAGEVPTLPVSIETSLSIRSSVGRVTLGSPFILTGLVSPGDPGLVGRVVRVEVKKPGRAYFSYSSSRLVYAGVGGRPTWWYRYLLKRGATRGTYRFHAILAEDARYGRSVSPVLSLTVR